MTGSGGRGDRSHDTLTNLVLAPREHDRFLRSPSAGSLVSGNKCSRHLVNKGNTLLPQHVGSRLTKSLPSTFTLY
jgi:hypothetical protein